MPSWGRVALPPGFATPVRDWLLVLLDGDARSRPRSATTIYVYFTAVHPVIACDGADAVSDVRPAGRVAGADGTLVGVEGRRAAGVGQEVGAARAVLSA
jgi:hypothetical protein